MAKIAAISLNALFRLHIVPSGYSIILEIDPVAPVNIDNLPAEHCFTMGFHFLIPGGDDWNYDTLVHTDVLNVYINSSKLDNGVGCLVYSGKLDLNIPFRLPHYCSAFQAKMMAIYRTAQWILVNGVSFTRVSIFFRDYDVFMAARENLHTVIIDRIRNNISKGGIGVANTL